MNEIEIYLFGIWKIVLILVETLYLWLVNSIFFYEEQNLKLGHAQPGNIALAGVEQHTNLLSPKTRNFRDKLASNVFPSLVSMSLCLWLCYFSWAAAGSN